MLYEVITGFQMMGTEILDEEGSEQAGKIDGMKLFPMRTVFRNNKKRTRVKGSFLKLEGCLSILENTLVEGYEIHMGEPVFLEQVNSLSCVKDLITGALYFDGACKGNCYGTYIHGIFDQKKIAEKLFESICLKKGMKPEQMIVMDQKDWKQKQRNNFV